jgi:hypothetical protein
MKIRSGFVSNSSSSSFVIAVDPGHTKCEITFEVDFSEYVRKYDPKPISTVEQLDEWNQKEWDGDMDKKTYKRCLDSIQAGKIILSGSFDDQSGDPIEEMFCNIGLKKFALDGVDIIQSDGGY